MFFADYHIHTSFSSDSDAPMESMILSAIAHGLNEIAFTDHVDIDDRYDYTDYNQYIPFLNNLKDKYKDKINIILGVEIGLEHIHSKLINDLTTEFPFEFIIGSSHSVTTHDLYFDREKYFDNKSKQDTYTFYFTEMLKNIQTCNDFCVYGHIDFISRYGTYDDNSLIYSDFSDCIDAVLKELISGGKGIEINTSGFRYGINQPYPQKAILTRYKELGGEIVTIGSDAHFTRDVADHIPYAYDFLKSSGFDYVSVFRNRKPQFIKI